jgi:hypothetical protein
LLEDLDQIELPNQSKHQYNFLKKFFFFITVSSCLAVSASTRLANVTNPTGDRFFPFLFVTLSRLPS